MSYENIKWFTVLMWFSTYFEDYRYLLSMLSRYKKDHPSVKSVERVAYYVLKKNYSTTFMHCMRFCYAHGDEFLRFCNELRGSKVSG